MSDLSASSEDAWWSDFIVQQNEFAPVKLKHAFDLTRRVYIVGEFSGVHSAVLEVAGETIDVGSGFQVFGCGRCGHDEVMLLTLCQRKAAMLMHGRAKLTLVLETPNGKLQHEVQYVPNVSPARRKLLLQGLASA